MAVLDHFQVGTSWSRFISCLVLVLIELPILLCIQEVLYHHNTETREASRGRFSTSERRESPPGSRLRQEGRRFLRSPSPASVCRAVMPAKSVIDQVCTNWGCVMSLSNSRVCSRLFWVVLWRSSKRDDFVESITQDKGFLNPMLKTLSLVRAVLTQVHELTQRAKAECCTTKKAADARLASEG